MLDYFELNCNLTPLDASGDEKALRNCPHETKSDIYCAHSEDIVVACRGDGDPTGVGAFKKEDLPEISKRKFRPLLQLSCSDKAASKKGLGGQPGALFLGSCPSGCKWELELILQFENFENSVRNSEEQTEIRGTFIYTDDSPVREATKLELFSSNSPLLLFFSSDLQSCHSCWSHWQEWRKDRHSSGSRPELVLRLCAKQHQQRRC